MQQWVLLHYMTITFIAGARPGASGPQTLAANANVELNQPVFKQ